MACWLGLDLGTSGVRAVLLEDDGAVLGTAAHPYAISSPRLGWAEQDPRAWWDAAVGATRSAVSVSGLTAADVAGVGVTGQMHGVVLAEAAGAPTRPAVIWPDRRCLPQLAALESRMPAATVAVTTGIPPTTGLLGPELAWLRQHEPDAYGRARWALLPKDFLRLRLTGEAHSEPSDAGGSLLFDINRRVWSTALCEVLQVDQEKLPPVVGSRSVVGGLTTAAADALGLAAGTPVVAGASDQATSALALGLGAPGDTSVAVSSGGTVLQVAGSPPGEVPPGVHVLCAADGGYLLMGAMLTAGLALRWLADSSDAAGAPGTTDVQELVAAAAAVRPGAEGLLFLPYLAGERTPHLDPSARGCFLGLTLAHGRGHLARAVMEGVAFGLRDCLDAVSAAGSVPRAVVAGGGGLRSPLWRQILADALDVPLELRDVEEHSATGAALLASQGIAGGDGGTGASQARPVGRVEPTRPGAYRKQLALFREAYRALAPTLHALDTTSALAPYESP